MSSIKKSKSGVRAVDASTDSLVREGKLLVENYLKTVLKIEENPDDKKSIEELHHLVKNFKELADMLDLDRARQLIPTLEMVLIHMKDGSVKNTPGIMDSFYRVVPKMKEIFAEVASGQWQTSCKKETEI
jgi:chemotaxis protein histidine kinase CheA